MSTIFQTYTNALLADATYALGKSSQGDLTGATGSDLTGYLGERMTPTIAKYIGDNFTVVTHIETGDTLGSGFDATVWRDKTGKLTVSMQGSSGLQDFLSDIDLAITGNARAQLVTMINWWLRETAPAGVSVRQIVEVINPIPGTASFAEGTPAVGTGRVAASALMAGIEVNGHSLGGYLASAFTRLFGSEAHVTHTSTFNGAGFAPGSETVFTELQNLIGPSYGLGRFPNGLEQSNYFAKYGINVTTNSFWFSQYGTRVELFNEEGFTLPNHFMYKMTDALALGAALEKLDTTLDNSRLIRLLEVGSNKVDASIEGLLDGVRRMLLGPTSPATPPGDVSGSDATRVKYHEALKQLTDSPVFGALVGKVLIHPASGALAGNARGNFSALVALQDLSPVYFSAINPDADTVLTAALKAIRPMDYNAWAADKSTASPTTFTNEWIADRAALLQAIVFRNTTDLSSASVEDPAAHAGQVTRIEFVDPTAPTSTVTVTTQQPGTLMLPEQFIAFGGDRVDILTGTSNSLGDHLYGGAGNDTLKGLGGDDRLEGGADSDTLIGGDGDDILVGGAGPDSVQGGKGYDTYIAGNGDAIRDIDGQGSVQLNDSTLTGGLKKSGSSFYLGSDGTRYMLAGNNHSVRILGTDGQTFTASSETGRFTVRHIYTKHYINDVYSGTSFRMEGDPSQCPLGIVLISEETREDRRRVPVRTGGGDPLALDLDGNGLQTLNMTSSNVLFDNDHNGLLERTGWLSGGDGFLVLDLNNNQKIDNGTELFGDGTLLKNGQIAPDGFVALAEYDTNNDLKIDVQDGGIWDSLQVWRDANTNGFTDAGELMSMVAADVKSIDVGHLVERTDIDEGNLIFKHGTFTKTDDTTAATGDILFATTSSGLISNISGEEDDIAELPNLGGSGDVASLHTAMRSAGGATLKSLVQQFLGSDSAAQRTALADQIVLVWMGTAADEADSGNGRMNATLAWTGRTLNAQEFIVDWENQYVKLREWVEGSLLLESTYREWFSLIDYKLQGDLVSADMTRWLTHALTERASDAVAFEAKAAGFMRALVSLNGWDGLNLPMALARALPTLDSAYGFFASGYELTLTDSQGNLFQNTPPDQRIVASALSTVTFDASSGRDTLVDGSTALDTVRITGALPSGVGVDTNQLQQMVLRIRDSNATMTLQINQGYTDTESLQAVFDDGTTWDRSMLVRRAELEKLYSGLQIVSGTGQADSITQGGGGVLVYAGAGNDTIATGSGIDVLMGETGDDILDAGSGDDTLDGGAGMDTIRFGIGTGNDAVRWRTGDGADRIEIKTGVAPADVAVVREGDDLRLMLGNGADSLRLTGWYSHGNVSVSAVSFSGGQVWTATDLATRAVITATTSGGDRIVGTPGDDRMTGGIGNDVLVGGAGNDDYLFGLGDGQDRIEHNYSGAGLDNDRLIFKSGVSPADVVMSREDYDGTGLRVQVRGTSDQVVLQGWYGNPAHDVKLIMFADGTTWNRAAVELRIAVATSEEIDVAWGADGNDIISGLNGDDQLHGDGGNDTLYGGAGTDWLSGGVGNDTLFGGADADSLDGDSGDDVLDGGPGDDNLNGGTGSDTYLFGRGDGQDVVRYSVHDPLIDSAWVELKAGVVPADVTLVRGMRDGSDYGRSLVVVIEGTLDQLEIAEWFGLTGSAVQGVRFADGTTWDRATIVSRLSHTATNGPEHLWGMDGDDTISGLGGDDQLHGEDGNDTLNGGDGDDKLFAGAGNDVVDGGRGADTLDGGAGSDTYRFGRGDDSDIVHSFQYSATPELEWVELKAGVTPTEVRLVRSDAYGGYSGTSLMVQIQGTSDQLEVVGWFQTATNPVQGLRFSDGTVWDRTTIGSRLSLSGSEAIDRIWGADGNDMIAGLGGDDLLHGEGGDDVLDGGAGDDVLNGGAGNDNYRFGLGSGKDVVEGDYAYSGTPADWVELGFGIVPSDLNLLRGSAGGNASGTNLLVQIKGTADQLEVVDWFVANGSPVQGLRFADGTEWDRTAVVAHLSLDGTANADNIWGTDATNTISGLAGDDYLHAEGGNDTVNGGAGNDTIDGGEGDDILDGGAGNDRLNGGAGNDTYRFGRGSGPDSIDNSWNVGDPGLDSLKVLVGVAETDVVLTRTGYYGADLMVAIRGTSDRVLVVGWFNNTAHPLKQIELATGTIWARSDMLNHLSYEGSADDDMLYGGDQANQLQGGAGSDALYGQDGDDVLDGGAGNDSLDGGNGSDIYRLYRGAGSDVAAEIWFNSDVSVDRVELDAGITPQDLMITRDQTYGDSLKIAILGTADAITLTSWFDFAANNRIEQLRFADGTVWDTEEIQQHIVSIVGAPGSPTVGTEVADSLIGTSSEAAYTYDWLLGMGGNDSLQGGSGHDRLDGGAGNDSLNGGAGVDMIDGGTGNDTLNGGAGDDTILTGPGVDTIVFTRGSGSDTVYMSGSTNVLNVDMSTLTVADTHIARVGNDLEVDIQGTPDKLRLVAWFASGAVPSKAVNYTLLTTTYLSFANGVVLDAHSIWARLTLPTDGSDDLIGDGSNEVINGLAGNDTIKGEGGDDSLIGGADEDSLDGGFGNDTLDGGSGNDFLIGGYGNDTFLFGLGSGKDAITDADGTDIIQLGTGLSAMNVHAWRDASNLYLGVTTSTDVVAVYGWFDEMNTNRIESVQFIDGLVWSANALAAAAFEGTPGPDTIYGVSGDSSLYGFGGDDHLYDNIGDDLLDGGTGDDTLNGGTGNDHYVFGLGYGQDFVTDVDGLDAVTLGTGLAPSNVQLWRDASNLYLGIENNADVLTVLGWFDTATSRVESIQFPDGASWDVSVLETAKFAGTEGHDYMTGSAGDDTLDGRGGDDTVMAEAGDDTADGGFGNDALYGDIGNDLLRGGAGHDILDGGVGDDTLEGGTGDDTLDGGIGSDDYFFGRGDGRDWIQDSDQTVGSVDSIVLKTGVAPSEIALSRDASNLYLAIDGTADGVTVAGWFEASSSRVERLEFADGTVWEAAALASAKFIGTEAADSLTTGPENDYLEARGGDDSLTSGDGDDTLDGGIGNDTLDGGPGDDSYLFGLGYGQDTVSDAAGTDVIKLGAVVTTANVQLWRDASNLYLGIADSADILTVQAWFDASTSRVESVQFADSTVWDVTTLVAAAFGGTAGADSIYGTTGNDTLLGFGGDDSLNGDAGTDTIDGGTGSDVLDGGSGDDVLTGGTDNDTLDGGVGNDRYTFARGDGQDTIHEADSTVGNSDTIALTAGIAVVEVALTRDTSNLYVAINGTTDKITVLGWYDDTANRVERIEFADGTVWDAAVMAAAKLSGTEGPDYLSGSAGNDALEGRGGNDTLTTDVGDDTLDGGTGNDTLDGGTGNDSYVFGLGYGQDSVTDADGVDVIKLGAGVAPASVELWRDTSNLYLGITNSADVLTVQGWFDLTTNRVESVQFADGTIWNTATLAAARIVGTAGMDYLSGTTGNDVLEGRGGDDTIAADTGDDTLDGGTGVDSLDGAAGNDSYLFGLGYGQDTITDAAGTDVIKLGAGLTTANVQLWRDTSNLYLGLTNSTDVLTVQGWFDLTTNRVESVQFADGTIWNTAALAAAAFGGTPGPDSIYGTTGNDTLLGFGGDDSITGDAGNDTLDGGTGSDILDGGAGSDGYVFGVGYGQDSITDLSGTDVIKLGAGLTTTNVQIWRDTSTLYLGITGSTDVLTVQGWFDATTNRVESVQFADGTIWNSTTLAAAAFGGTPGADSIYGTTGNNTLYGFAGNDYLYADAGNDVLDGGTGDDMLDGGAGNDTYRFSRGYGLDTVAETSGTTDLIQFDANTAPTDVLVSRDTSHLYLSISGTTDKLTIQNWYADALYRVEQVSFTDGTNWTVTNLNAKTTTVTEAADFYWGTTGNDTVNGLGGDDQLVGNEGNDALSGGAGNDVLNGGTGTDTLLGGIGDDSYVVDATTDVVTENASEGSDTVRTSVTYTLGANLERLELLEAGGAINGTGNSLANTLVGNTANNTLNGGAGSDTLIGGVGNDTYVVDDAADVTTENLNEGSDLVNASISWTLATNVEKLTLTGTTTINGTGNELANTLTGNSAANVLTGGAGNDALNGAAGADTLIGGLGNDSYTVDNAADVTTENPGEGTDTVSANRSWTLGANLENLTLTGSTLINATGNELNNVLTGNSAANVLTGDLGNDTLKGLAGNDQYVFGRGMGADLVQENDTTAGNTDLLQFLSGVSIEQVWLRKVSNDLEVSIIGTTDKVTFTNWYLNSQYHVEQFKTSDGKTLADTDVQNLVTAMAGYAPPAEGQLTLPADYWTALSSVITANWH